MDFDEQYPHARTKTRPPSHWPKDVRPISLKGLDLLGVDSDGKFYWDGKLLETRSHFRLTKVQATFAILAALATIIMAVVDLLRFIGLGKGGT